MANGNGAAPTQEGVFGNDQGFDTDEALLFGGLGLLVVGGLVWWESRKKPSAPPVGGGGGGVSPPPVQQPPVLGDLGCRAYAGHKYHIYQIGQSVTVAQAAAMIYGNSNQSTIEVFAGWNPLVCPDGNSPACGGSVLAVGDLISIPDNPSAPVINTPGGVGIQGATPVSC